MRIKQIITDLSSLHTRYYTSDLGAYASEMIYKHLDNLKTGNCTVDYFNHATTSPKQRSIIAKIQGTTPESIIYCAHIDSINAKVSDDERETARSPGADDNATGVANVLEAFRVLCNTHPTKTLEFHFYAGEEQGLRGSAEIAEFYKVRSVQVGGVLNADMTGYTTDGVTAYIVNGEDDYVDAELVDLCFQLAKEYTHLQLKSGRCGYACSDHASWGRYGYPSACVSEATPKDGELNPHNHSALDDISNITFDYTYQHARLGLGFMIEMGFTM
jgi:leucyl aminopeptidase